MMVYIKKKSVVFCDVYYFNDIYSEVKFVCMF